MILRQVRDFTLAVSPSEPPAVPRRGYRASGFVLGREPRLQSAPREGPESAPKPSFHCEREVHFTAHCRSSRLAGDRSPLTQNESVPEATNIKVNGKRKAADPEK